MTLKESYIIAELIRKDINENEFCKKLGITISVGLGEYMQEGNIDIFLKRIDKLVYKSKLNGKNKVKI